MNRLLAIIIAAILWIAAFIVFAHKGSGYEENVCMMPRYLSSHFVQPGAFMSLVDPLVIMKERVLGMVKKAGFDPVVAEAVIQCESGWNPKAKGDSGRSWGLWQIHQPAHALGSVSFDPYLSTAHAIKLLKSERSWSHWSCWTRLFQP